MILWHLGKGAFWERFRIRILNPLIFFQLQIFALDIFNFNAGVTKFGCLLFIAKIFMFNCFLFLSSIILFIKSLKYSIQPLVGLLIRIVLFPVYLFFFRLISLINSLNLLLRLDDRINFLNVFWRLVDLVNDLNFLLGLEIGFNFCRLLWSFLNLISFLNLFFFSL